MRLDWRMNVQYQTFRGADVQEALSSVKAALGPNAVIESTRHVTNGRRGGFDQSFVEVIAAPPKGNAGTWPFSADIVRANLAMIPSNRARSMPLAQNREPAREMESPYPRSVAEPAVRELERKMVALRTMLEELNSKRSPRDRALAMLYTAGINGRLAKELAHNLGKSARSIRPFEASWQKDCARAFD